MIGSYMTQVQKNGIQSIIWSVLAWIFGSDIITLECNIFQPAGPLLTFLTENQQIIEIWGNCPIFGVTKQHFPNIWLNCVFFNRNISKRKFTSIRSNLQSGSDMAYHPQRVKGFSVSRNCLRQNQVRFC